MVHAEGLPRSIESSIPPACPQPEGVPLGASPPNPLPMSHSQALLRLTIGPSLGASMKKTRTSGKAVDAAVLDRREFTKRVGVAVLTVQMLPLLARGSTTATATAADDLIIH